MCSKRSFAFSVFNDMLEAFFCSCLHFSFSSVRCDFVNKLCMFHLIFLFEEEEEENLVKNRFSLHFVAVLSKQLLILFHSILLICFYMALNVCKVSRFLPKKAAISAHMSKLYFFQHEIVMWRKKNIIDRHQFGHLNMNSVLEYVLNACDCE